MEKDFKVQVSFCLPVYNVRPYLEPCIRSICGQGLDSYEIICVDDRSSDGSLDELKRLSGLYPNMKVLCNEENRGVGYSRNRALQEAVGKYVWFVDPDDMLLPGAAPIYLAAAEEHQAEAVLGNLWFFYDGTEPVVENPGTGACKKVDFAKPREFYCSNDQAGNLSFGIWLGVFLRDFLVRNGIRYVENLPVLEDFAFYFESGIRSKNSIRIDYRGYLYRLRGGSITRRTLSTDYTKRFECARKVLTLYSSYLENPAFSEYEFAIRCHLLHITELAALYLAAVLDRRYAADGMRWLKERGYYPYRQKDEMVFFTIRKAVTRFVLKYVLPFEPAFWLFHCAYVGRYWIAKMRAGRK